MKIIGNRQLGILISLFLLFITPGMTAVFLYTHPDFLGSGTINKGTLMRSAVQLPLVEDKSKWALIYWSPETCTQSCLDQLDKLSRIRLALGRHFYNVNEWLVFDKQIASLPEESIQWMRGKKVQVLPLGTHAQRQKALMQDKPKIFIVSPARYFVLSYALDAPSEDIYKDLKHLLNQDNKIGSSS